MEEAAEDDDDGGLEVGGKETWLADGRKRGRETGREKGRYPTWMMKIVMGFLGSYSEGLAPSRIPPWWGARSVLEGVAEAIVAVMTCVTVVGVFAAMLELRIRNVEDTLTRTEAGFLTPQPHGKSRMQEP